MTEGIDPRGVIGFTRDLVRCRSVLGGEGEAARAVVAQMTALGFDDASIDEAGNAVGVLRGRAPGPCLLFDGHLDTVDVVPREAWTWDPFGGEISDGRMYGRGTSDMKGAIAAMVYGAALVDRDAIQGSIVVSASVGEELVEGAALRFVLEQYPADFVVIGEASNLDIVFGGRGRAEWKITTHGVPAHASSPHKGDNAVHKMLAVVAEIEKIAVPGESPVGPGVVALTDIISDPYPAHSVIPSGCTVTYERRLVPGETEETVTEDLRRACRRAEAPETSIELATIDYQSYTGWRCSQPKWFPAWALPRDDPFVVGAQAAMEAAGLSPGLASYQFCTNAAYSTGIAGIPTIGLGPSDEAQAHIVDESIEVEELVRAVTAYRAVAEAVLRRS